ncbi:LuxR family transcriptional regulator [Ideonella sp. 4Y16]|uniref:LuxR C-terminal-related transcriptional regulator n=1 Tax=Ideonella alba TaxID=2824118 RepID=UPI001B373319|nr:LuxR C-terminal-related transcriptional regulator [Ideonella alba]MBQ0945709.1 LuxR family transcriptional regulator [Ideonella alba]
MNAWALPLADAQPAWSRALPAVVQAVGAPDFDTRVLQALDEAALGVGSWSVYQVWRDRPPQLHLSGSRGVADTTRDCFAAYRDAGLYRRDSSFDAVRPGHAAVLRMHADEAPSHDHRQAIYLRHGVLERLSVVQRGDDGAVFAVNVYRHAHQGRFGDGELAGFAQLAPVLLAGVQRHLALRQPAPDLRAALKARCAALTERELDVCERLLRGWSFDGIAADLGLSVATAKTYRARAFTRLGLHFKSELFAAFLPGGDCPPQG